MKIHVARSAGFCFGVKRAIAIALQLSRTKKQVKMLGDIVHNEEVVQQVKETGIQKISRLKDGKGKTLLIRAHGTGMATYRKAAQRGYEIVDATCPMVKEIHTIARTMEARGYRILIIGDKKHDEVRGIMGQLTHRAVVIDSPSSIPFTPLRRTQKAAIVVQSTQDQRKVGEIVSALKPRIHDLKVFVTICRPTRLKQQEIKEMPLANEVMIIIGSQSSANTRRLYEISKTINPRSYWIQSEKDVRKAWFHGVKTVGITSGSSTPDTTTQGVIARIKTFTKNPSR